MIEERADERGGAVDEMFEIVEHEQEMAIAQGSEHQIRCRAIARILKAEGTGDCCLNETRIAHRREPHEPGAVRELALEQVCHRQREAGFADASRSGERQEPGLAGVEQRANASQVAIAPDQWCCGTGPGHAGIDSERWYRRRVVCGHLALQSVASSGFAGYRGHRARRHDLCQRRGVPVAQQEVERMHPSDLLTSSTWDSLATRERPVSCAGCSQ